MNQTERCAKTEADAIEQQNVATPNEHQMQEADTNQNKHPTDKKPAPMTSQYQREADTKKQRENGMLAKAIPISASPRSASSITCRCRTVVGPKSS